jgi:hypothetical protein
MIKNPNNQVTYYRQIPRTLIHLPTYQLTTHPREGGRKLRVLNNLIMPNTRGKYLPKTYES